MTHVKIFSAITVERIQQLVNNWLNEYPLLSVIDIKWDATCYGTNAQSREYTAMIIYKGSNIE